MLVGLPFDFLYARFEVVPRIGRLAVMELELIELMLYLFLAPTAAPTLAVAALARLARVDR